MVSVYSHIVAARFSTDSLCAESGLTSILQLPCEIRTSGWLSWAEPHVLAMSREGQRDQLDVTAAKPVEASKRIVPDPGASIQVVLPLFVSFDSRSTSIMVQSSTRMWRLVLIITREVRDISCQKCC